MRLLLDPLRNLTYNNWFDILIKNKGDRMNKDSIIALMMDSLNKDNREMAERSHMEKEQIDKLMQDSQMTLQYMMMNLYERMKVAGLLKD